MSTYFVWTNTDPQLLICKSSARCWEDLKPAWIDTWCKFLDVLATKVPIDLRNRIEISFFASSGRACFSHARRATTEKDWRKLSRDYIWTAMCECDWVESQWNAQIEDDLGKLGVFFAAECLRMASHNEVVRAFERFELTDTLVVGRGVTQSPAPFEVGSHRLMEGRLPELMEC